MGPLAPYPDPEARTRELTALCAKLQAERVPYGESVLGRELSAVRVPGPAGAPRVVVCANIHGVELIGNRVAAGFLRSLATAPLRQRAEVWVLPCLNPDGYARTWERMGQGRVAELRGNARGVDLNRNFPLPWGARPSPIPATGSLDPSAPTYRGPHPLSEPEAGHLVALLERIDPWASVSLHSFMGTVIPPRLLHAADRRAYRELVRSFRQAQGRHRYVQLSSPLDVFTGELEDYQHHVMGTWAVCVETFTLPASFRQHLWAPSVFWRFNPKDPEPWVDNDVPAIHALLHAALDGPRPPRREGAAPGWTESWDGQVRAHLPPG